jgi:hypothetical protein
MTSTAYKYEHAHIQVLGRGNMAPLHLLYDFAWKPWFGTGHFHPGRSELLGPAPGRWYIFFGQYYQRDNEV